MLVARRQEASRVPLGASLVGLEAALKMEAALGMEVGAILVAEAVEAAAGEGIEVL